MALCALRVSLHCHHDMRQRSSRLAPAGHGAGSVPDSHGRTSGGPDVRHLEGFVQPS